MNNPNIALAAISIGLAVLMVGLSIPLVMRKVGMNRFYGVRIPKSFSSDANWFAINAYGGRQLIIWSTLPLVAGIVCFFVRIENVNRGFGPVLGGAPVVLACLIALIRTLRFARTL